MEMIQVSFFFFFSDWFSRAFGERATFILSARRIRNISNDKVRGCVFRSAVGGNMTARVIGCVNQRNSLRKRAFGQGGNPLF